MDATFETEQEAVGRRIADVPELSGALAFGDDGNKATRNAEAMALCVRLEWSPQWGITSRSPANGEVILR